MNNRITARFADNIHNFSFKEMPEDVIMQARRILLDTLGVILAATSPEYSAGRILTELVKIEGGNPECTLIGRDFKTSCIQACLVNGTMAYYCDNEPHHLGAILHPAAVCVPTSLAFAERGKKSGKDLLTALTLGIEVSCKVSYAINPQALYRKGLHPTSIACGFGALASGSFLLDLNQEQIVNGLGLVGNQASGLLAWASDQTENSRPFNPGIAARNGATAALLADLGFGGPISIFDGKYNIFKAFSDGDERREELFNQRWRIKELAIKLYSSCSFTHPGLDALLELMDEYHLTSRDIERIDLRYPKSGAHMIDNNELKSHCAQYVFAVATVRGQVVIDDILQDHLDDPEIERLSKKMRVIGDVSLEKNYPDQYESIVELETKDGRNLSKYIDWPKGSQQRPLSYDELREKFFRVVTTTISKDRAEEILTWVENAEKQEDVEGLCRLLRL
jgi:2-methylcitrate dehydratase PrpD